MGMIIAFLGLPFRLLQQSFGTMKQKGERKRSKSNDVV
ncbi:hypothetical protein P343_15440 [Sporolactobacillus laevolacticus DSM 442]|uniref:Uncharacterized protein n=1 Tax=Sporolactobacillus laevolacticus DSM 442 TaxID=1395513 RepID=V6J202_9BACL|nr:hypothetical protein P343_15440 [Sporolactobacillus laevolacticus DSM 442]